MSIRSGPVFFLAALATLALLGPALFGLVGHASPASFTLFGSAAAGWGLTSGTEASPGPDLTAAPGETVILSLNSDDGSPHDWGVDYNDNGISDAGEPKSAIFTTSISFTFDATTAPGTYRYYCFIHGSPMVGSFIVQPAPDFSLSATPTLSVNQGSSGNFTVSLQSVGGFSGNVALAVTVSPGGPSVSASPSTVALAQGGVGSAAVTVSAVGGVYSSVATGVYNVRVTGTGESVSRSVDVAVTVGSPGGSGVGSVPPPYLLGGVAGAVGLVGAVVLLVRRGRPRK